MIERLSKKTALKFAVAAALLATSALGGCSGSTAFQTEVSNIEAQVQADANTLCGFIPTIATIAGFIPAAGAIVADAATIAEGVCKAVTSAPVVAPTTTTTTTTSSERLSAIRAKSIALGVNVSVGTVQTPQGPVQVVGQFTR